MDVIMYQRTNWQDKRLAFDKNNIVGHKNEYRYFGLDKLWIPDLFMRNAIVEQSFPHENLLKINSTGWIWFVEKKHVLLSCPMYLHKFPMDTQSCSMFLESFGYKMDDLYFTWLQGPVDVDSSAYLPEFTLHRLSLYDCSMNYTQGAFPCLEVQFQITRDIGNEVKQLYLPSCFVVVLSWLLLFIDNTHFGIKLLIGCFMEYVLLDLNILVSPTKLSYFTAADVWTMICMSLVFGVICQCTITKYLNSKDSIVNEAHQNSLEQKVNMIGRIVIPMAFSISTAIYVMTYAIAYINKAGSELYESADATCKTSSRAEPGACDVFNALG